MNNRTQPVIKLVLAVGLGDILLTLLGIADRRDVFARAGTDLISCSILAIVKLVK